MGLLDKLFKSEPDYPALESDSEAARQIRQVESVLESLAENVSDKMEIVPANEETYIFLGKPPKVFGLAWIRDGKVKKLNDVVEAKGIPHHKVEALVEQVRAAYDRSQNDERYNAELAGRTVVVTLSEGLRDKVHEVVEKVVA